MAVHVVEHMSNKHLHRWSTNLTAENPHNWFTEWVQSNLCSRGQGCGMKISWATKGTAWGNQQAMASNSAKQKIWLANQMESVYDLLRAIKVLTRALVPRLTSCDLQSQRWQGNVVSQQSCNLRENCAALKYLQKSEEAASIILDFSKIWYMGFRLLFLLRLVEV